MTKSQFAVWHNNAVMQQKGLGVQLKGNGKEFPV